MHGAHISESQGLDMAAYGDIGRTMAPSLGEFLKHESGVIRSVNYVVSQSALKISIEAMDRILKTTRDIGINADFPAYASRLFRQADAEGFGDEELASVIKVLRKQGSLLEQAA